MGIRSHNYKFGLGDKVALVASMSHSSETGAAYIEAGVITGQANYPTSEDHYLVRYVAGDKRVVEAWWGESALVSNE